LDCGARAASLPSLVLTFGRESKLS
jgi:hypothetical protein